MRIDLVGPVPPVRGGISRYTARLYAELRRRHDTRLICFRHLYPGLFYPGRRHHEPDGDPTPEGALPLLDGRRPLSWLRTARAIRRRRPDLLILSWWVIYWVPLYWLLVRAARSAGSRVLFLCHNVEEHERRRWKRRLTRLLLRRGDVLLVHAEEERQRVRELIGAIPVRVVPLPVFSGPHVQPFSLEEARRRLGLGADEKVILFFGFVRPYKGLSVLLRALPEVLRNLKVRLLVAGEFWEKRERYDRLIARLGIKEAVRIDDRYIPDEEMAVYFRAADVVALPYTHMTGSGISSMALAFHKPIVGSAVGALKDVTIPGKIGLLVPPGDERALASALVEFFSHFHGLARPEDFKPLHTRLSWEALVEAIEAAAVPPGPGA